MTKISNLSRDLEEEVLSKVPVTFLRRIRSTCKKWNTLSTDRLFAKKHLGGQAKVAAAAKEFMVVTMMDFRVCLMRVNLYNNNTESCIRREAKLTSLEDSDQIDVCQVFHCDGILLCVTKDNTKLVVWDPYRGQTRWIEPTHNFHILDKYAYALGYDKSNKSHKILRFIDLHRPTFVELKIYDFNSDSWRSLDDVLPEGWIRYYSRGVSLRGNTYWFARKKFSETSESNVGFLISFDFTKERFGPRLPLPFKWYPEHTVSLSSVKEDQLAVLFQRWDTLQMEIWVTTEIEPNTVTWNSKAFLTVNLRPLIKHKFQFSITAASFFIDEEKQVAVVFDKDKKKLMNHNYKRNVAYIVGVDGSFKEADLGENADQHCYPLVCSYVPSLVQLN